MTQILYLEIWLGTLQAGPCRNLSLGICGKQRPRSACTLQFDQGLHYLQTESLGTTEFMNGLNGEQRPGSKVIKLFSCSTQLSMKFSLLINMKMPTKLEFSYLLAEKFSCSAMFSKKEFVIVSNLRFISRTNLMLSWVEHVKKKFYNLGARMILWTCAERFESAHFGHVLRHFLLDTAHIIYEPSHRRVLYYFVNSEGTDLHILIRNFLYNLKQKMIKIWKGDDIHGHSTHFTHHAHA